MTALAPTVIWAKFNKHGQSVFTKDVNLPWHSKAILGLGKRTPQGDPRLPMVAFGQLLSLYLGFEIIEHRLYIEFRAPNINTFRKKVFRLNQKLGARPISYSPIQTKGIVTDHETVKLSAKLSPEGLMAFAFSEDVKPLIPHQITFHLTPMLLPTEWIHRIIKINELTLELCKTITQQSHLLGPDLTRLIVQFMEQKRAQDIDLGTGNYLIQFLLQLQANPRLSISQVLMLDGLQEGLRESAERLNQVIRWQYTPLEWVISLFANIFNLPEEDRPADLAAFNGNIDSGLGTSLLTDRASILKHREKVKAIINEFHKIHYNEQDELQFPRRDIYTPSNEYYMNFAARRKELEVAVVEILSEDQASHKKGFFK